MQLPDYRTSTPINIFNSLTLRIARLPRAGRPGGWATCRHDEVVWVGRWFSFLQLQVCLFLPFHPFLSALMQQTGVF